MIDDGEGMAIACVAEFELALEVGPEVVGGRPGRQVCALGPSARPAGTLDQTVPAQDRMDCALGGNAKIAVELSNQELAGSAGA